MEAILKGLPPSFSNNDLARELEGVMAALGISSWQTDKARTKPHGWVYFPDINDGLKFLSRHSKITDSPAPPQVDAKAPRPIRRPDIARLHITKKPIYVEKSNRAPRQLVKPQHSAKKAQHRERPRKQVYANAEGAVFYVNNIDCGHNFFHHQSKALMFARQTGLSTPMTTATLTQQSLTISRNMTSRIEMPCQSMQDFIANHDDHTITVVLAEPPRFYALLNQSVGRGGMLRIRWERRASCPDWNSHELYASTCLVYRLSLSEFDFKETLKTIEKRDIISVTNDSLRIDTMPAPYIHDYTTSVSAFQVRINQTRPGLGQLPFMLKFQIQALVWNNYVHPATGLRMIDRMEREGQEAAARREPLPYSMEAMRKLLQEIPFPCPGTDPAEVDADALLDRAADITRDLRNDEPLLRMKYEGELVPEHQAWVMKATVTPTRIILNGPEAESKNRILRMFSSKTDYFIRCMFADDDGQDLAFSPNVSNDAVFKRYRDVLSDGVDIAGRHFAFLGFSHSSLRSHSVWLMAPFIDDNFQKQDYHTIIESLGNFKDIRVPAKCAARIGQAFSETPYAVPVFEVGTQSRFIPDVKSADGSRIFSDGVGTISWEAAREFWGHLPKRARAATCFQVRWAGAKGMLALDTRLKGKVFCIRKESMRKFPSDDIRDLGICDTASKPLRLMLNRQMIKILEDMGTPNEWFVGMQNRELRIIRAVTATASNTSTFLRYNLVGVAMSFPQFIRRIDRMGADYRSDVFLKTVVEHTVLRELRLLKHKARIPVEKGVTLFGVMDETGYLQEDEIYVTFDKAPARIEKPPTGGRAIITRSPALHPGDIRLANVVMPPPGSPLYDLRNCIVFSQHGKRDLPSQLSGGDLDGDLYNIIWDEEAMPKHIFSPADYPRVDPQPLDREVTRDDIADFFINFMRTDILGMIATRHQIIADVRPEGTADPDCLTLASMHSTAVDSSKTGIPVEPRTLPKAPATRPDFLAPVPPLKTFDMGQVSHIGDDDEDADDRGGGMGRPRYQYHKSNRILGTLYRNVDEKKIWRENISAANLAASATDKSVWVKVLEHANAQIALRQYNIDWRSRMDEALRISNLYEDAVYDLTYKFSDNPRVPITEVEVFCGCILNKRGGQTRRQRDSSIKLHEEVENTMEWVVKMMCERGERGPDQAAVAAGYRERTASPAMTQVQQQEAVVSLCLACLYAAGAHRTRVGAQDTMLGTENMQSFKVVAASCLLRELDALGKMTGDDNARGRGMDSMLAAMGGLAVQA